MSLSDKSPTSLATLSPADSASTRAKTLVGYIQLTDQSATECRQTAHLEPVPGRQAGFPATVNDVINSLRAVSSIPNWAITRQRNDGSLTIMSAAEPLSVNENVEEIAPSSSKGFVLDHRKYQSLFSVEVLDEERQNIFGNLVGYRTGGDLLDDRPIEPRDAALAELFASMLSSVLAQDRRAQIDQRAEERLACPERDAVTGCLERSAWLTLSEAEGLRLSRFDDEALVVAVRINDLAGIRRRTGIETAEELCREVAFALHSTISKGSLIARLGEDTFASVLCSTDPSAELRSLRARIESLRLPVKITAGQRLPSERSLDPAQRRAGLN